MLIFSRLASAILVVVFGLSCCTCDAQTFQYPPYGAQRGRMLSRDGIGHVTRYHWGNGLTPTGGAFLTSAVTELAPAFLAFAGSRDFESDTRSRDSDARSRDIARAERSTTRDRLAIAQEEANDLLLRTARLLDDRFAAPNSQAPINIENAVNQSKATNFGSDPWPSVPTNSGSGGTAGVDPSRTFGPDPWPATAETLLAPKGN